MFGSVNFLWRYAGLFGSKLNDLVVQEAKPQFVGDYSADILSPLASDLVMLITRAGILLPPFLCANRRAGLRLGFRQERIQ